MPHVQLSPIGGNQDDGPAIQAALDAAAYEHAVTLGPGTYTICTVVTVPSGTVLVGHPGVHLISTLAPSGTQGSPLNSVFYAAPPPFTVATTLAAPTAPGTDTITVADAAGFPVGMEIALIEGNHLAGYVIRAKDGGVLTLDRTVVQDFAAGSAVVDRVAPKDIRIQGNGMTISGTGDAAVEISGAWRCVVEGLRVEGASFAFVCCNFDVGSRGCILRNCHFDCGGTTYNGWHFEDTEFCLAEHVYATRATHYGFFVTSGFGNRIVSCESRQNALGAILTRAAGAIGTHSVTLEGCRFVDNAGTGLGMESGSGRIAVIGCEAFHNGGAGFAVNLGAAPSSDVHFVGCFANRNQNGFVVSAGCTGVTLSSCTADECVRYGLDSSGDVSVNGFVSRNCVLGAVAAAVGEVRLQGFHVSAGFDGPWVGARVQNGGRCRLADGAITMGGAGTKIAISHASTSVTHVAGVRTTGGTYGWFSNAGCLRRGPDVDFSSCATPYHVVGAGQLSFGAVTLDGAHPIDHLFSDTKATDRPRAVRTALGGTPGHFTVQAIPGLGIRVTGQEGDSSVVAVDLI